MATPDRQVYLITGANRGIGRAILTHLAIRDNLIIIAAVRDPTNASSASLVKLPSGQNTQILIVKIDSTSETDALAAAQEIQQTHHITRIDTVIANAGIGEHFVPLVQAKSEHVRKHVDVNVIGPLLLFQAILPLLENAPRPKFVLIGAAIGSIAGIEQRPAPMFSYAASKAMAHYLVRKIHSEHENVIAFAVDPGFVQSDMGNAGARQFGMPEAPVPLADSATFVVGKIDESTKENMSGRFPSISGGFCEW